jgi:hypothetical protein
MSLSLDGSNLGKKRSRIRDIPMLAEFSIPKTEHIDRIEFHLVARRWKTKKSFVGMSAGDRVVDEDEIVFGDDLVDSGTKVRDSGKKAFVEVDESGLALARIGIVLNIIVVHELIHNRQVALAENFFIEIPNNFFIGFRIHERSLSIAKVISKFHSNA